MKIIIVDDDQLVCASLKTILEAGNTIEVLATGNNADDAVSLYQEHRPEVLLMDIRMKERTGLEAAQEIIRDYPDAKILFLTTFSDDEYILEALRVGAKGYLIKQAFDSVLPSLLAVGQGQSVFGGEIVTKLPDILQQPKRSFSSQGINPREQEVIELVAKGRSNREIADTLYLSEGTVRNYLSSILDKLELRDRTQLAVYYYTHLDN